jgi:hypothetical protein
MPMPPWPPRKLGLGLNAGHDLNRDNLPAFVTAVKGLQEVSIGHAFMADALELGYSRHGAGVLRRRAWVGQMLPAGKMIYGIGTDICDIRRIKASLDQARRALCRQGAVDAEMATWKARSARWPERGVRYLATRFRPKKPSAKPLVWACACP